MRSRGVEQDRALGLLRRAIGEPECDFRQGQWEAIAALVNDRKKLLIVERTGWGKSIVYFVATRILRDRGFGPTLIISPLLALMRNQVKAAERLGIRAQSINSTNRSQWPAMTRSIKGDHIDALLISPERLANDAFIQEVLLPIADRTGLVVVDEAHCISDWGHDFRPDYRRLVRVLKSMPPNMPILGTTATANNRVLEDIRNLLGDIEIQRGSLSRETLALQTLRLPDQAARLAWLAEHIRRIPGTGIIYVLTKRDAQQVSDWLNKNGISACAYYSGVASGDFDSSDTYREHLESQLLRNDIKALVATTSLGMGYDKPDLGFVIHYQAPSSIITYYQQVGRAGRGIKSAVGVLLSGKEDEDIHDYFRTGAFPDERHVESILKALEESDGMTEREIEEAVNLRSGQIESALKFLSVDAPSPVLKDGTRWRRTAFAYEMDKGRVERLTHQRVREWAEVQRYMDSQSCLMFFLAKALDDEHARPCGNCARCLGRPIVPERFAHEIAVQATRYLRHSEMPLVCNKQVAKGSFVSYGLHGNLPPSLRAEEGRILSHWGDAGWGIVVAEDKRANRFRDELVEAMAGMVSERWKPEPVPTWVTCIPSLKHPDLVPNFPSGSPRA